jgi:ankyrin repeat protein
MAMICPATGFDLGTDVGVALRDDHFIETIEKGDIALVRHLLDSGTHPDTSNLHGTTGLMKAAYMGSLEIMELLLERGATIDAKSDYGETPLIKAILGKEVEAAKLLVERGADPDLADANGEIPAALARRYGPQEMVTLFEVIAASAAIKAAVAKVRAGGYDAG